MEDYKFKNGELVEVEKEKEQGFGGKMSDRTRSIISNILYIATIAAAICSVIYNFYASDLVDVFTFVGIVMILFSTARTLAVERGTSTITKIAHFAFGLSLFMFFFTYMGGFASALNSAIIDSKCATERVCQCVVDCNNHNHSTYSTCN